MKQDIVLAVKASLKSIDFVNPIEPFLDKILLEKTKNSSHGDFSSNICMILAKKMDLKPLDIANSLAVKFN